jgi:hypothetical protein
MDLFDWQAFVDCVKDALYSDALQNILDYAEMGSPVVCVVCKREIVDEGHHVDCPLAQIQREIGY